MRIWPEKTVDQEFADLGTAGWSGTLNDRQFAYLRNAGYTGGLADMMFQLRTAPVIPAFTPASIFTGTDEGFWADVTPSRLWQDVARTTPVTAAGQSVASWELTTRTGVIYAEQPTAGSRPVYQLDGSAGYLDFNGNRWMSTSVITPASDKAQLFAGLQNNNLGGGTRVIVESTNNSDAVNGIVLLFYGASIPGDMRFRSRGAVSPASNGTATSGTVVPDAAKISITGLGDIAADSSIVRLNGTQIASAATDQGTGNYGAHQIFIGGRTSIFYQGRVYGLALRFGPNLTAGQITDMEGWMNSVLNP